jgi:hypothetical protein
MKIKFALLLFAFLSEGCLAMDYAGVWHAVSKCPEGYAVALNLKQKGESVYGKWEMYPFIQGTPKEINTIGGHGGTLYGKLKDEKVLVFGCTDNEAESCQMFDKASNKAGYLDFQGNKIRWTTPFLLEYLGGYGANTQPPRSVELQRGSGDITQKGCSN